MGPDTIKRLVPIKPPPARVGCNKRSALHRMFHSARLTIAPYTKSLRKTRLRALAQNPGLKLPYHQSTCQALMNMKTMMKISLCLVTCAFSLSASAKDDACLFQGKFTDSGSSSVHEVVNTCAANKGMSERDFKMACQDLSSAYTSDRNPSPTDKFTRKTGSGCPANSKGTCEGVFGVKMNLLYMEGDSSLKNGQAKLLCEAGGGKWKR
jgi:hypothetical protein